MMMTTIYRSRNIIIGRIAKEGGVVVLWRQAYLFIQMLQLVGCSMASEQQELTLSL